MVAMVEYRLLTIWRIEAPLDAVYVAVRDSQRWPEWWPGALAVTLLAAGDASGLDSVRAYLWRAALPYRLSFTARTTHVEAPYFVEASIAGDLEGDGSWRFAHAGALTVVRHEWRVQTTRRWMNLCPPLAHALFTRNHQHLMQRGAEALARRIGGRLQAVEHGELAALGDAAVAGRGVDGGLSGGPSRAVDDAQESWRMNGPESRPHLVPFVPLVPLAVVALLAGTLAGAIATAAQMLAWCLADLPVWATLLRDARLTAAIVMGPGALPTPPTDALPWKVLLVAALVHVALSFAYALLPARLAGRLRVLPGLAVGAVYGLLIYVVNMYGFTVFFPWFALVRDPITLFAHLVFGTAVLALCRCFAERSR